MPRQGADRGTTYSMTFAQVSPPRTATSVREAEKGERGRRKVSEPRGSVMVLATGGVQAHVARLATDLLVLTQLSFENVAGTLGRPP